MKYNRWSAVSVFFASIAVIALQLMIMRAISVTHYYHFSYLVISTALLGFGASGTFLALFFDSIKKRFAFWNLLFFLLFLISIPVTYGISQSLPLDTQYVLYSRSQLLLLVTYNLLIFIPFFFGGTIIGFMISYFKSEVPELYGANLIGSGAGGVAAIGLMFIFPAWLLPVMITPVVFLAMLFFLISAGNAKERSAQILISAGVLSTILALVIPPPYSVDPYKDLSRFQQLERQQDAELVLERFGPRGQVDLYSSPTFHHTLFAGPQAAVMPPRQLALLLDGEVASAIFTIDDPADAAIMDFTPQSLPYRLLENPSVLLLGETGGVNVWLAKRMGAEKITVVQTNPQLIELMTKELPGAGGQIYLDPAVEVVNRDPRLFIEQADEKFDLIHIVEGEAMAVGTGGLQGLNENYLLTTESIAGARELLTGGGLISITRGIQSPPRDNLKIISMFANAVSEYSDDNPADHLLVSRNYLAANTLLSKDAISQQRIESFREEARNLQLDLEYFPGIDSEELEQLNIIEGPETAGYSFIHHAVNQILFGDAAGFYRDWAYDVRAPTDNRPYFQDFFKWSSLGLFLETYGEQWFQRLELGYVILVITFLQLSVVAFLLIILPLVFRRKHYSAAKNKWPTFVYFFSIGTGFMFIEITLIQTFSLFLGDPIFSVAAILSSILVFSGIGSAIQKKLGMDTKKRIRIAAGSIILLSLLYLALADPVLSLFIGFGTVVRFFITILLLMPVSFFFGWMFPSGVNLLQTSSDSLIPWAWGVDGFASVAAAPLAIILSMSIGFSNVILLGAGFYLLAGCTSWWFEISN